MMCQKDDVAQKGRIYNTSLNQKNTSPVYLESPKQNQTLPAKQGKKKTNSPENVNYVRLVLAGN